MVTRQQPMLRALLIRAPALAPNEGGLKVSSKHGYILHSKDLTMLRGVLDAAGYNSERSVAHPERYGAAFKLIIERFQCGMTSARDLSRELEKRFGKPMSAKSPLSFERTRASIQGRPLP